jgi:hypothetical protein
MEIDWPQSHRGRNPGQDVCWADLTILSRHLWMPVAAGREVDVINSTNDDSFESDGEHLYSMYSEYSSSLYTMVHHSPSMRLLTERGPPVDGEDTNWL